MPTSAKIFLYLIFSLLFEYCFSLNICAAARLVGTGAPVAAIKQMNANNDDQANPFAYPFLSDIAKSLARSGIPPGFFLGLEGKNGPGIDLRTILLYEAGVLKSPIKLFLPGRKKREENGPTLNVPLIPETTGEMLSATPKLNNLPIKAYSQQNKNVENKATEGDSSPSLSLDMTKFSLDLSRSEFKNELTESKQNNKDSDELPKISMSVNKATNIHPASSSKFGFRFWTHATNTLDFVNLTKTKSQENTSTKEFSGSYVLMTQEGLKSIEGHIFNLSKGKALFSNQGNSLVVITPVATVTLDTGSTVLIDCLKEGLWSIRTLETGTKQYGVSVKFNSSGKAEELRLGSGNLLIVADHNLSSQEKNLANAEGHSSNNVNRSSGENWLKSSFTISSFIDKEEFLKINQQNIDPELKLTLESLIKRLK